MKSSSRAGRFKKKLVSEEELRTEAPEIEARMAPLLTLLRENSITEAEFTALALLATVSRRYPGTWLGARSSTLELRHKLPFPVREIPFTFERNIQDRLKDCVSLGDLLKGFALRSTPLAVNRALLKWSTGDYGLRLFFHIPTPSEVLAQQTRGERCVTVLTKASQLKNFILGERDHLSFVMHDLIHADHFYHDNVCFQGQVAFYRLLDHGLKEGHFKDLLPLEKFAGEFEYLISDMNAYPVHLMKCLKSAMIFYHPEGTSYFDRWAKEISSSESEVQALCELNGPAYRAELQDQLILNCLQRFDNR